MEQDKPLEADSFASFTVRFENFSDTQALLGAMHELSDKIQNLGYKVCRQKILKLGKHHQEETSQVNSHNIQDQQKQQPSVDGGCPQNLNQKQSEQEDKLIHQKESQINREIGELQMGKAFREQNFKCTHCMRSYNQKDKLQRHMRLKHQKVVDQPLQYEQLKIKNIENPFPCMLCNTINQTKYMLKKHLALDHTKKQFLDSNYEREKFITKRQVLQYKNAEQNRAERAINKEVIEEEENQFEMFLKRFAAARQQNKTFPLQTTKFKLIYKLFQKAEVIQLDGELNKEAPSSKAYDDGNLYIYPLCFFKQDRFSQLQVNTVFHLLKISYFLESQHVMKLSSIKRGKDFIAFHVRSPQISLEHSLSTTDYPPRDRLKIAKAILSGLRDIHEAGYVHGDIKPDNILIDKDLSRIEISCISNPRYLEETVCDSNLQQTYYSPKELSTIPRGSKIWDYYAFGAICFRLLIGETCHLNQDPISSAKDPFTVQMLKRLITRKSEFQLLKMCLIQYKQLDADFEQAIEEILNSCTFEPATYIEEIGWQSRISKNLTEPYERQYKIFKQTE